MLGVRAMVGYQQEQWEPRAPHIIGSAESMCPISTAHLRHLRGRALGIIEGHETPSEDTHGKGRVQHPGEWGIAHGGLSRHHRRAKNMTQWGGHPLPQPTCRTGHPPFPTTGGLDGNGLGHHTDRGQSHHHRQGSRAQAHYPGCFIQQAAIRASAIVPTDGPLFQRVVGVPEIAPQNLGLTQLCVCIVWITCTCIQYI